MTKEITKAHILQQIQDKFSLREFEAAKFLFSETVLPIYDMGRHLYEQWQKHVTESVTEMGTVLFYSVPDDEQWTLSRYDVVFMTGAYTIAGIYIVRPVAHRNPGSAYIYLDLAAAQNTSYHVELHHPVVLEPHSFIYASIDGYTTTGDLRLYIDYMMEKMR